MALQSPVCKAVLVRGDFAQVGRGGGGISSFSTCMGAFVGISRILCYLPPLLGVEPSRGPGLGMCVAVYCATSPHYWVWNLVEDLAWVCVQLYTVLPPPLLGVEPSRGPGLGMCVAVYCATSPTTGCGT